MRLISHLATLVLSLTALTVNASYRTPAYIEFQVNAITVSEGQTNAILTVIRSGEFRQLASVDFEVVDNTATSGADFRSSGGTVVFPAGVTMKTITIPLTPDSTVEANETFSVKLTPTSANTLVTQGESTVTITDWSEFPTLEVQPAGAGQISLSWSADFPTAVLQRSVASANEAWEPVQSAPVLANTAYTVVEPVTETHYFYRLRR